MASLPFNIEKESAREIAHWTTIGWSGPSNIALVKYWGKHGLQLPSNPSLSFTLANSVTHMKVKYRTGTNGLTKLSFEGERSYPFEDRIRKYLVSLKEIIPFLQTVEMEIESSNTFPHSAGIASSASSMSALALILCSIENQLFDNLKNPGLFYKKASYLARLASGSACRSVYGGFVCWGETEAVHQSSMEYAVPFDRTVHKEMKDLRDAVLIIQPGEKSVSSSAGHELMNNHPYASQRFNQARENLNRIATVIESGDFEEFIEIVESEALTLHGLMMTSQPGFLLLHPNSIKAIHEIRAFREYYKIPVCFTIDAGPNIHLIYPGHYKQKVEPWINESLISLCDDNRWIDDEIGGGPQQIKTTDE